MSLENLLNANKDFCSTHRESIKSYQPESHQPLKHWAIVTCMSQHLTGFMHEALGFRRGDALFIQNAGNTITPYDNSIIRSLVIGIYLLGVKEVAVIGHTNCNMKSDVMTVIEALKKYGQSREILKGFDPREWFGLITNEEINVRQVVDAIKHSPIIPKEIPVYGLMFNTVTGELTQIYEYHEYLKSESKPEPKIDTTIPTKLPESDHHETKETKQPEVKKLTEELNLMYKSKYRRPGTSGRR